MTAYTIISALLLAIPAVLIYRRIFAGSSSPTPDGTSEKAKEEPKTIMQPPRDDLAPPKDDPFTLEQLKEFNGSDPSKPIYVAIKGMYALFSAHMRGPDSMCRHHLRRNA